MKLRGFAFLGIALLCSVPASALGSADKGPPDPAKTPGVLDRALGVEVLADGTYLITDGGGAWRMDDTGSEILIVDRAGKLVWDYSEGLRFAHSAIQLKNGNILIPDTNNNRLLEVGRDKKTKWSSESWPDGRLSDGSRLDYPNHVQELPDGHWLVSDRDNSRVVEVDRGGRIYWTFAQTKRQHAPVYIGDDAAGLGRYLVADSEANRVFEFDRNGRVLWSLDQGLAWPRCIEKLENGNYLITDSNHNRVLELTPEKALVREFKAGLNTPYEAHRLADGNTLVCDAQHGRIVEFDGEAKEVWSYGGPAYPAYPELPADLDYKALSLGVAVDREKGIDKRPLSPGGWYVADMAAHASGAWSVETDAGAKGRRVLALESRKDDRTKRWWGQRLAVKGGDRLNLFVRLRAQTGPGSGVGFGVAWIDAKGGQLGGGSSRPFSGEVPWTTVPLAVVAPPRAAYADLGFFLVGPGKAWFGAVEAGKE